MMALEKKLNPDDSKDWAELCRRNNIQRLEEMGIEPTDEAIKELEKKDIERIKLMQEEVERKNILKAKKYFVGMREFDSEEEAKEYQIEIREVGRNIDLVGKAYDNSYVGDYPYSTMVKLLNRISWERQETLNCDYEVMYKLYILGKIDGIRSERARRKGIK